MGVNEESETPTETELNPPAKLPPAEVYVQGLSFWGHCLKEFNRLFGAINWLFRVFTGEAVISEVVIIKNITWICLVPLFLYLFFFYASAADKALFFNLESLKEESQGKLRSIEIINPTAIFDAFQDPWNLVVILFPIIFITFAIVAHHFAEQRKWGRCIGVVTFTFLFDCMLAIQISQKTFTQKRLMGLLGENPPENWKFMWSDLDMWTVLACGFGVSLLASFLYYVAIERGKDLQPFRDESLQLERQVISEKSLRQTRLIPLTIAVETLESRIDKLNNEYQNYKRNLDELSNQQQMVQIKTKKHPTEVKVAVLKTEMQYLQDEIDFLSENVENIEQGISESQTQISPLLEQQPKTVIDLKKVNSQVSQFVNGWSKYIAQDDGANLDEVNEKIKNIRKVKDQVLKSQIATLHSYSSGTQENLPEAETL